MLVNKLDLAQDARTARNPATGESVAVPATKVVEFKPAAALKATSPTADRRTCRAGDS